MTITRFQKTILAWYKTNRRDLPWRRTKDPYKILVSEVMLQQTQVSRVLPKYKEFLRAFPTLQVLARASNKKLLKVWSGLGYWKRALFLKETAKLIVRGANSLLSDPKFLQTLPGIGHYTARALACFAFGSNEAFLDTNIRRVYLHFFFPHRKNVPDKEILAIAQKAVSSILCHGKKWITGNTEIPLREWHYALMDYGAKMLKDKKINRSSKHYHKQSRFEGSFRSFRTQIMRVLLERPNQTAAKNTLTKLLKTAKTPYPPKKIFASLEKDGLIKKKKSSYSL